MCCWMERSVTAAGSSWGNLSPEETEQDGTYTVYMDLETGAVEDIWFLSERGGGNG